ncbi:MAG: hypothetical protein ACERKN_01395 [Velocimicrobium sp.]
MFIEKLNKKQDGSIYVVEEKQAVVDGKYEGYLEHDNANLSTVKVYSKQKLAGDELTNVILSIPSETPWKTYVKIFATVEYVFITYETTGDTIEAEDINVLQEAATRIQEELEHYREVGSISGGTF